MMQEICYDSKLDKTRQMAMFQKAQGTGARPLLVGLHTWSFDYSSQYEKMAALCGQYNWHFIFPNFRGPNWHPDACGSEFVVSDLEDAVRYVRENADIDETRIYLCGGSGGGHCSLLLAGRRPDIWTAVSSWCPITDIGRWHRQCAAMNLDYYRHIECACGGNPGTDAKADREAVMRSPVNWLLNAEKVPLAINCGIHDGHTGKGSVPVDHSILAFNLLAKPEDRISPDDMAFMLQNEAVPEHLLFQGEDPAFGKNKVLFRRISNKVRLTVFDGGHEFYEGAALEWLSRQVKEHPVNWENGSASAAVLPDTSELTK